MNRLKNYRNLQTSFKKNMSKTLSHLKNFLKTNQTRISKLKQHLFKLAHEKRLKTLITQFHLHSLNSYLNNHHTTSFLTTLRLQTFHTQSLHTKSSQLTQHINFLRTFKLKTTFLSFLRLSNYSTKVSKRQQSLE